MHFADILASIVSETRGKSDSADLWDILNTKQMANLIRRLRAEW